MARGIGVHAEAPPEQWVLAPALQQGVRQFERLVLLAMKRQWERLGLPRSVDPSIRHEERFQAALLEAIQQMPTQRADVPAPRERIALRGAGFSLEPFDLGIDMDPAALGAAEYAALLGTGLSPAEMAREIGAEVGAVKQRLEARTLYGIGRGAGWVLPRFQLDGAAPLQGLERVVPRLDPELDPVAVYRWFTLPNPDLYLGEDEEATSPREWLRAGEDPGHVADLAAEV